MGMKNLLFLVIGGDFKFYCLQVKNPMAMSIQPKKFSFFPLGMRVYFRPRVFLSLGRFLADIWPIFPVVRGPTACV